MSEPTVQVPVSLIERILVNDDELDATAAEDELRALLSQPVPTSGLTTTPCPRCIGRGFVGLTDCHLCSGTGNVVNAAPPSIADMVPGTEVRP